MKKLLIASLFALTLLSCSRDESEIQSENLASTSLSLRTEKNTVSETQKTTFRGVNRYYSDSQMKHYFGVNSMPIGSSPNTLSWRLEGPAFTLSGDPVGSFVNVLSMVNPYNLDNVLVTTMAEKQSAESQGYVVAEDLGYAIPEGTFNAVPVYRYYRPSKNGHLFTKNFSELGSGGNGWVYEGIAFYAY